MRSVPELEHEVLSPSFIRWLRDSGELDHVDCDICEPTVYESGLVGNMWTRAIDCPLCGTQIRTGAEVLTKRDYELHLDVVHYPYLGE